ncbi:MAG: hypothetical protein L0K86_17810 [Actinomycetia bacterium]|nr:hypothetical protein [Actinomycetes bacterium]
MPIRRTPSCIAGPTRDSRPWTAGRRLRPRARKALLATHIVASGGWIGADLVLGVLVVTALSTTDPALAQLCWRALPLLVGPILAVGLLSLGTGVLLGLGTHLGLVRYWWVTIKLVLTSVLLVLVTVLLRPSVTAVAGAVARGVQPPDPGSLIFPPIVSGTALVFMTVLSLYRPWGRIRSAPIAAGGPRVRPAAQRDAGNYRRRTRWLVFSRNVTFGSDDHLS